MLTTLANVKTRFAWTETNTDRDAAITALIASATAECENYCRRTFDFSAAITEKYNGRESGALHLNRPPVHSVASVHASRASTPVYDATTLLAVTDYGFDLDGRLFRRGGLCFPCGEESVQVVYSGGYGTGAPAGYTAIPTDLEQSVIEMIQAKYQKGIGQQYHLNNVTSPEGQISGLRWEDEEIPRAVWSRYRLSKWR